MAPSPLILLTLVAITSLIGFYFAYQYSKRFRTFSWKEYAVLVIATIISVVPIMVTYGKSTLLLFALSILFGLTLEHLVGYLLHKSLKRHIWRYYRFTLGGYTSLLIAPFWGMAGLFFFLLSKTLGL